MIIFAYLDVKTSWFWIFEELYPILPINITSSLNLSLFLLNANISIKDYFDWNRQMA